MCLVLAFLPRPTTYSLFFPFLPHVPFCSIFFEAVVVDWGLPFPFYFTLPVWWCGFVVYIPSAFVPVPYKTVLLPRFVFTDLPGVCVGDLLFGVCCIYRFPLYIPLDLHIWSLLLRQIDLLTLYSLFFPLFYTHLPCYCYLFFLYTLRLPFPYAFPTLPFGIGLPTHTPSHTHLCVGGFQLPLSTHLLFIVPANGDPPPFHLSP